MLAAAKNLSISTRLILALFPILVGLCYLSYEKYEDQRQLLSESRVFITLNQLVTEVGGLIHNLQKERGMSALFLGSKGNTYRAELREQRQKVDQALSRLEEITRRIAGEAERSFSDRAQGLVTEVRDSLRVRTAIDALTVPVPEQIAGYTRTIAALIDYIARLSRVSDRADVNAVISADVALIECIERAGQERAIGSAGFSGGSFANGLNRRVLGLVAEQEAYLAMFRRIAAPRPLETLEAALAGEANRRVETLRRAVVETVDRVSPAEAASKVGAADWFAATTQRIDALKAVSDRLQDDLRLLVQSIHDQALAALTSVVLWILVGAGFAGIMMSIVVFGITRPVSRLTRSMSQLAGGDVEIDIPEIAFNDEVGQMATAMKIFRDGVREQQRLTAEQRTLQEREEDLSRQLREDSMGHLKGIVEVAAKSNEAFFGLAEMGAEIRKIASDSQAIAAAVEELVASAGHIAENSLSAEEKSRAAARAASEGLSATEGTLAAMERISAAVRRTAHSVASLGQISVQIGEMIGAIEAIASQTNLLALNATIEAARAGEAGKGFAVVASEVKQLANQTAKVTDDIRQRIDTLKTETRAIVSSMEESARAVEEGQGTISGLATRVEGFRSITEEVTGRMSEVAGILQQHNHASTEIASTVSGIAAKTGSNVEALNGVLDLMDGSLKVVNERVDKFAVIGSGAAIVEIAKKDHSQFRNNIISVALGRKKLGVEEVSSHLSCRFGKWYSGAGREIAAACPAYGAIDAPHKQVHDHARKAVELANAGEVDASMREVSLMNDASRQVLKCLDDISAYYGRAGG
jgi:methyl-accepting chemotaxis protein